jgi:hypothetical protein
MRSPPHAPRLATRLARGVAAWAVVLGVVRLGVTQPERCTTPTRDELDHAIEAATQWAVRTQEADGTWTYRYDLVRGVDFGYYEYVRHAGLTMSLYQVDLATGSASALATADRGTTYLADRLRPANGGQALDDGSDQADTGAVALWLAGLAMRHQATNDTRYDDLMRSLGRFLVGQISPRGAVAAYWDASSQSPDASTSSPFYTGETSWALALLHEVFPNEGWDRSVRQILHYLSTERDDAEDAFPPIPDHWAAHTFEEVATWPVVPGAGPSAVPGLDADEARYAIRIAQLESMQIRYESQRTGSTPSRLTRGEIAVPAGLGAITEALGGLWRVAEVDSRVGTELDAIAERATCAAGLLVSRQIDEKRASTMANPGLALGAWERAGETQIDDQQHALSGLLAVRTMRYGAFAQ